MALGAPERCEVFKGVGAVAELKWGTKRTCLSCGAKFYDFAREPIVCPSCEVAFKVETPVKQKRVVRSTAWAKAPKKAVAEARRDDEVADNTKIDDDSDTEDEDDGESKNDIRESDPDEDIEAELSSEIDTGIKKGEEGG